MATLAQFNTGLLNLATGGVVLGALVDAGHANQLLTLDGSGNLQAVADVPFPLSAAVASAGAAVEAMRIGSQFNAQDQGPALNLYDLFNTATIAAQIAAVAYDTGIAGLAFSFGNGSGVTEAFRVTPGTVNFRVPITLGEPFGTTTGTLSPDGTGSLAGGNIHWDSGGNLSAVTFTGDGSGLSGLQYAYSSTVADHAGSAFDEFFRGDNVFNVGFSIANDGTGSFSAANGAMQVDSSGGVHANMFLGDGSNITNLSPDAMSSDGGRSGTSYSVRSLIALLKDNSIIPP